MNINNKCTQINMTFKMITKFENIGIIGEKPIDQSDYKNFHPTSDQNVSHKIQ